jgi:hypothetical protein
LTLRAGRLFEQADQNVPVASLAGRASEELEERALLRVERRVEKRTVRPQQRTQAPQRHAQLVQHLSVRIGTQRSRASKRAVDQRRGIVREMGFGGVVVRHCTTGLGIGVDFHRVP